MNDALTARLEAAGAVAREAGALARDYFRRRAELAWESKGVQDLVSVADKAVEEVVRGRLLAAFPEDGFLGEEGGAAGAADAVWVVDPIDGTSNFLRGFAYYAVSIAFVADGDIAIGAVYDPSADELFLGARGRGATCNGRLMRVSSPRRLAEAVIAFGHSRRFSTDAAAEGIKRLLAAEGEFRQPGAAALMLAHVADGRFDGFYEAHNQSWDALAGMVLAREAGAVTNDFLADGGLTRGNVAMAVAPGIHAPLCQVLREAGLPLGRAYPAA